MKDANILPIIVHREATNIHIWTENGKIVIYLLLQHKIVTTDSQTNVYRGRKCFNDYKY